MSTVSLPRHPAPILLALLAMAAPLAPARAAVIAVPAGPQAQERVQQALIDAKPGDVVALGAGRFDFTDGLSLDVARVTLRGAGKGKTILSFAQQKSAGDGLLITGDGAVVRGLTVQDPKGDGLKAKGVTGISFLDLVVEWTGGPKETNGGYGVYPVASKNVLIDRVTVRGASDAGIYVGQSETIVVQRSRAEFNVAGIEIENSVHADVHDNVVTRNAGGILVFDLPNLPKIGGHSTRVYRNKVVRNDTPNFAAKGNTVAQVPTGTGVMINANLNVHVFDNDIGDNQTTNVMVVAYRSEIKDERYNPLPRDIVVRDNRFGKAGWAPQFPGGAELAKALGGHLPPIVWDGAQTYDHAGGPVTEATRLSVANNGPVVNLHFPKVGADVATARPEIVTLAKLDIAEPAPVVLPEDQRALAK